MLNNFSAGQKETCGDLKQLHHGPGYVWDMGEKNFQTVWKQHFNSSLSIRHAPVGLQKESDNSPPPPWSRVILNVEFFLIQGIRPSLKINWKGLPKEWAKNPKVLSIQVDMGEKLVSCILRPLPTQKKQPNSRKNGLFEFGGLSNWGPARGWDHSRRRSELLGGNVKQLDSFIFLSSLTFFCERLSVHFIYFFFSHWPHQRLSTLIELSFASTERISGHPEIPRSSGLFWWESVCSSNQVKKLPIGPAARGETGQQLPKILPWKDFWTFCCTFFFCGIWRGFQVPAWCSPPDPSRDYLVWTFILGG